MLYNDKIYMMNAVEYKKLIRKAISNINCIGRRTYGVSIMHGKLHIIERGCVDAGAQERVSYI